MIIRYESELRHHGVKGMRWGVRRARRLTDYTIGKRAAANSSQSKPRNDYDDYDSGYNRPSWMQRNGKKLAIGLGAAAAVTAGALIANRILKKRGSSLGKVTSTLFKDTAAKGKLIFSKLRRR